MDRLALEETAEKVIQENNVDPSNGYDIVSLAKGMGFYVGTALLDENEDGFIMVNTEGTKLLGTEYNKIIVVNDSRDLDLKRFIIAHELGHYVINGKDSEIFAHRKKEGDERADNEQEVDYFAASLLMPKSAFSAKYKQLCAEGKGIAERVVKLKNIFRAPMESVLRRIEELGLVANGGAV